MAKFDGVDGSMSTLAHNNLYKSLVDGARGWLNRSGGSVAYGSGSGRADLLVRCGRWWVAAGVARPCTPVGSCASESVLRRHTGGSSLDGSLYKLDRGGGGGGERRSGRPVEVAWVGLKL